MALWDLDRTQADLVAGKPAVASIGVQVDVTDRPSVEGGLTRIEAELGPIDVLVNNAGINTIERFFDSKESRWQRLVANISSDAGRVGSSGEVGYSGTKGAVISFSKGLAREVAAAGVTVEVVCQAPTETALLDQVAAASQKPGASQDKPCRCPAA